jgi:hypothetical protein
MGESKEKSIIRYIRDYSGIIFGLVGVILAIYFYNASRATRELSFYCYPVKTSLIRTELLPSIEIYIDKEKIQDDISIVQVALYNMGKKPIETTDILDAIKIYTDPRAKIIDAIVTKVSREIIGFNLDKTNLDEGYLGVSWRTLEQNDGAIIQIAYLGGPNISLLIEGIIKEQKKIKTFGYPGQIKSQEEQIKDYLWSRKFESLLLIISGLLCLLMAMTMRIYIKQRWRALEELFIKIDADPALEKPSYLGDLNHSFRKIHNSNISFDIIIVTLGLLLLIFGVLNFLVKKPILPPI